MAVTILGAVEDQTVPCTYIINLRSFHGCGCVPNCANKNCGIDGCECNRVSQRLPLQRANGALVPNLGFVTVFWYLLVLTGGGYCGTPGQHGLCPPDYNCGPNQICERGREAIWA